MSIPLDKSLVLLTFYNPECLCGQSVDAEDVPSYLAVSSCHPHPGHATWRADEEGSRFLCLGNVAAWNVRDYGELPGLYLIHQCCYEIIAGVHGVRPLFDCFRALGLVLHEIPLTIQPSIPWPFFFTVYAPILQVILSTTTKAKPAVKKSILRIFEEQIPFMNALKGHLPPELSNMILDYLPCPLAIILDHLSGGTRCLRRLRQDPITRRFDLASQILRHEIKELRHLHGENRLESSMIIQYMKFDDGWLLEDLYAGGDGETSSKEQAGRVHFVYKHSHDRSPYIAVQVNDAGITHIAFVCEGGQPKWISPNKIHEKAAFFQDRSNIHRYDSVVVISDVREANCLETVQD
jgi:hypothetical protein